MARARWASFDPLSWRLTNSPGCYVLNLNSAYLYIGSTTNLAERIEDYKIRYSYSGSVITPWGTCCSITGKFSRSLKYGDWLMLEARLIRRLHPILNCKGSRGRIPWKHSKFGPPLVTKKFRGSLCQVMASVDDYVGNVPLEVYR